MRRLLLVVGLLVLPATVFAQQAETIEYYGTDAIGSIRIVWDASGNVIARQDFTPFGEPVLQQGIAIPKEGFDGNESDAETNQDYFHARMFEARTGRFSRTDPIEDGVADPQKWNRYTLAVNNPLRFSDPLGLDPDCTGDSNGNQNCSVNVPSTPPSAPYPWPPTDPGDPCSTPFFTGAAGCQDPTNGDGQSGGAAGGATGGNSGGSTGGPTGGTPPCKVNCAPPPKQKGCANVILNDVNKIFGTLFTDADVTNQFGYPAAPHPGEGWNIQVQATDLGVPQFNAINPGRYPVSAVTLLTGKGATLHLPANGQEGGTAVFIKTNNGQSRDITFTAHLDSADPYNPWGAMFHLSTDVLGIGRNLCPQ